MSLQELIRDLRFSAGVALRQPFNCLIQVTNRCNMRCTTCGFWSRPAKPADELSLDDFRRLEKELSDLGCFLVSLEGGEPLLREDIVDIVRIFSARHVPILYTNGWFVDEPLARSLFSAGLAQAGVSIDDASPEPHDRRHGMPGTWKKAWDAVELLRNAAPHGGKQVHVMTVLMQDNRADLEPLLEKSAALGVGHCLTLLSRKGFCRGSEQDTLPRGLEPPVSDWLMRLWERHPHMRFFRNYIALMDSWLTAGAMPECRAGIQSFNIDHVGGVSPCIEKINSRAGNVREEPLSRILPRLSQNKDIAGCQDCWTLCRACCQFLGSGGALSTWWDLATRMRSS